jgi:hypothetical protein
MPSPAADELLPPRQRREVFDRRFVDWLRQHSHRRSQEFEPPGAFTHEAQGRLAQRMMKPPLCLEDAVGADALGDTDESGDGHYRNANPLEFLR